VLDRAVLDVVTAMKAAAAAMAATAITEVALNKRRLTTMSGLNFRICVLRSPSSAGMAYDGERKDWRRLLTILFTG